MTWLSILPINYDIHCIFHCSFSSQRTLTFHAACSGILWYFYCYGKIHAEMGQRKALWLLKVMGRLKKLPRFKPAWIVYHVAGTPRRYLQVKRHNEKIQCEWNSGVSFTLNVFSILAIIFTIMWLLFLWELFPWFFFNKLCFIIFI